MRLHRSLWTFLAAIFLAHAPFACADAVLEWNEIALAGVMAARQLPPDAARSMAMVHVAMFDAVNAIERRYKPIAHDGRPARAASPEAASIAAAHAVLSRLFPGQAPALDAAYGASLSRIAESDEKAAGVALGREAASRCLEMRAQDGAGAPGTYRPRTRPGVYFPTIHPISSEWASVKPWVMSGAAQFRPPPPRLDASDWSRDLEEIHVLGGRASAVRNAEQTDVARFWAITGPASWNPIVRSLARSRSSNLLDNARLFALANVAATDAFIAVFDAKYAYEFWRPVTAIRHSGLDTAWLPLVDTPMHPEYPCAHCISAAAVATVLEAHFGRGTIAPVIMTSPTAPGVTRTWTRIADFVQEVKDARVWGGVHYRTSTEVGERMGRRIGELAVRRFAAPIDERRGGDPAPAPLSMR